MQLFAENMKRSFGLWKNKDVVNNRTDGPGLLTEVLCMATREENCSGFLLTPLLRETLHSPPNQAPVFFMHLQTSVTLIDTLWNSFKLHFHLKSHTSSQKHRRLTDHYGTEEPQAMQKKSSVAPPHLTATPAPFSN